MKSTGGAPSNGPDRIRSEGPHDVSLLVLILNWNNWEETCRCLRSILGSRFRPSEIVIVDNGSEDRSSANLITWLSDIGIRLDVVDPSRGFHPLSPGATMHQSAADTEPRVTLLCSPENRGYSGGNNLGMRYAMRAGADYVLLLNDDTRVSRNALSQLIETAERFPGAGLIGCKLWDLERSDVISYQGERVNYWLGGYGRFRSRTKPELGGIQETNMIPGAAILIKRAVVEGVGLLNEDYFLYGEDIEYCFRTRSHGWRLLVNLDTRVWHRRVPPRGHRAPYYYYYSTRNHLDFARQHLGGLVRVSFVTFLLGSRVAYSTYWLFRGMFSHAAATFLGVADFLSGRMGKADYRILMMDERARMKREADSPGI